MLYLQNFKRHAAHDPLVYYELWNLKTPTVPIKLAGNREDKEKMVEIPLLPVTGNGPEDLLRSPLIPFVVTEVRPPESESISEVASASNSNTAAQVDRDVQRDASLEAATTLLGPGPYSLYHEAQIPHCDRLHASYHNPIITRSNMRGLEVAARNNIEVKHNLKLVMRVERGDDRPEDRTKDGKKKRWDIVVMVGVGMLDVSHICS